MASKAYPHDPDFTYFREEGNVQAKCNYCGGTMDPAVVEAHRVTSPEKSEQQPVTRK